jgi:predicted nucleic acid-binding Zn ribbon protein
LFKGEGFYLTDYRSDSYKSDAKKDKDSPTEAPKASESKKTPESK